MKKLFVLLIIILLISVQAHALDRYVNPACASACDGTTWAKGWATFAAIVWTDLDDETSNLYLGAGTYAEPLTVAHNTNDSRLTILPYNGTVTITNPTGSGIILGGAGAARAKSTTINGLYGGNRNIIITGNAGLGLSPAYYNCDNNIYTYLEITDNGTRLTTTLSGAATAGDNHVHLTSVAGIGANDIVKMTKNDATFESITVASVAGDQVNFTSPYTVSTNMNAGNTVVVFLESTDHGINLGGESDNVEVSYCLIKENARDGINQGVAAVGAGYGRISIHHNTIQDNFEDAINVSGKTDLYNNTIDGTNSCLSSHADAIQGSYGYWRIYNNLIKGSTQQLFLETVDDNLSNVLVYNNIFEGSEGPAINIRSKNLVTQTDKTFSTVLIANNDFIAPATYGIRIFQDYAALIFSSAEISNNIFYLSTTDHVLLEASCSYAKADLLMYSNVFYSPNTVGYNASDDAGGPYNTAALLNTGTGFTGNTNSQPIFTNYAGGDYTLSGSDTVAISAGKDLSAYLTTDYAGNTRSGSWDIGAYEFIGNMAIGSGPAFTFTGPAITLN